MLIIFARHGETVFGKEGRFEGISNSALTKKGEMQARLLSRFCERYRVEKIYISPLLRAVHTARFTAKLCHLKFNIVNDLREICYGEWEGQQKGRLRKLKIWNKREDNLFEFRHPGEFKGIKGESYEQLFNRLKPLFQELMEFNVPVLIVAHLGVIRCARMFFDKIKPKDFSSLVFPNKYAYLVKFKNKQVISKIVGFSK